MKIFYKRSQLLEVLLLPLIIVSIIFRCITGIRRFLYMHGVLASYRAESRIISVGNLTVGGTGKTPMVIYLCTLLAGKRLAVVSRGYGSKGRGIGIVSDGKKILLGPGMCGDEPYLIAKSIRNAVIAVGKKKAEVIRFVEKYYNPDIIILDDGFSHLKVKRDLDIVLIDGEKGFGNGHLLPAGPLREPIGAMRYADSIGVKGKSLTDEKKLKEYALQDKIFHFTYRFNGIKTIDHDDTIDVTNIKNKRILAIAGIAFPDSLFKLLDSIGIHPLQCIAKSDHSKYDKNKLNRLTEQYAPDVVIVTAKDAVKIKGIERDERILWLYADIAIKEEGEDVRRILHEKGFLK
jgi:tetraacyldisaccharide 4'-kinase